MNYLKKLSYYLIGLALALLILLASFPKIASKTFGKKIFQSILSQKLNGSLNIGSLSLSWKGPQKIYNVSFEGESSHFSFTELRADLPLWDLFSIHKNFFASLDGPFELNQGSITFFGEKTSAKLEKIFIQASPTGEKSVEVSINGVSRVNNESGSFSIQANIKDKQSLPQFLHIQLFDFPSIGIDQLIQVTKFKYHKLPPFSTLLGRKTNLSLLLENKNLDFDLNSTLSNLTFTASYLTDRLVFTKPLYANFRITSNINSSGIRFLTPATLYISEKNFILPIPFSLEKLRFNEATLDMGQLEVKNNKTLSTIIGLMKFQSLQGVETMTIWTTPVNLSLHHALLRADRLDALLANSIHIATWGDINLKTNQLDMILGLPADTLEHFFYIPSLPENYVMQIPLKGTLSKPKINAKEVAAKIASLSIASQASKNLPGLGVLFQMIDSEKAPPAKKPFPWER